MVSRVFITACILLAIAFLQPVHAQNFKLISYNILEGMKTDTTKGKQVFVNWIKEKDPDVLALQECNGFTQKSLEELARSYGHPYAVIVKHTGFPVGLTSKYPIVMVQKVNDNMTHGFIRAKIENYNMVVLHLNPHRYEKRREEISVILKTIAEDKDTDPWLVMGDFNAHSPLDKPRFKNGHVEAFHKAMKVKYPHIENLVKGEQIDFVVQQRMLDAGFVDAAFRYDEIEKAKTGKGVIASNSRIDFIYVSKELSKKILYCGNIYDEFTKKHSDHTPVQIELKK